MGTVFAVKFRSRCLKINPMIKSAASAASPMTKMQGSSRPRRPHAEPLPVGPPLHFGYRGGCASSRLDHAVDLQASRMKFCRSKASNAASLKSRLSRYALQNQDFGGLGMLMRSGKHPAVWDLQGGRAIDRPISEFFGLCLPDGQKTCKKS